MRDYSKRWAILRALADLRRPGVRKYGPRELMRLVAFLLPSCLFAQPVIDYGRQVHPVLAAKCGGCHSQEKRSGGLSLGSLPDMLNGGRSGAAVKPGDSAASLLIRRSNGDI